MVHGVSTDWVPVPWRTSGILTMLRNVPVMSKVAFAWATAVSVFFMVLHLQYQGLISRLAIHVVITAIPLLVRRWQAMLLAAVLLSGLVYLTLLSVGMFYVPSIVMLLVGVARTGGARRIGSDGSPRNSAK